MSLRGSYPSAPLSAASLFLCGGLIVGTHLGHPMCAALPLGALMMGLFSAALAGLLQRGDRRREVWAGGLLLLACFLLGLAHGGCAARDLDKQRRLALAVRGTVWLSGTLQFERNRLVLIADSLRVADSQRVSVFPGGLRLLMRGHDKATPQPPRHVAGFARLEPAEGPRWPGGWDSRSWSASWGVAASIRPHGSLRTGPGLSEESEPSVQTRWRNAWASVVTLADRLRIRGTRSLQRAYPGVSGEFLARFLLGRKAPIANVFLVDDFRASGLGHILAVSGFHVGCVAAGLALLIGLVPLRRWPRSLLLVAGLIAYGLLVGGGNAVTRAVSVASVWLILRAARRTPVPSSLLHLVLAIALWVQPFVWQQAGFQLTYLVTWALLRGARRGNRGTNARNSMPDRLWRLARGGMAAQAAAWPLALVHWGGTSPLFLVSNLLFAPLATLLVPSAVFGLLLDRLPGFPADLACGALRVWIEWLLHGVAAMGELCRQCILPGGLPQWLGIGLSIMVGLLAGIRSWRPILSLAAALAPALAAALVVSWPSPGPRFVMLDVGQGESWMMLWREETWVLDTGASPGRQGRARKLLVPTLRWFGRTRIDHLMLTHDDLDHTGGLAEIVSAGIEVGEIHHPVDWSSTERTRYWLRKLVAKGATIRALAAGDTLRTAEGFGAILHPAPALPTRQARGTRHQGKELRQANDRNEESLVLLLACGEGSILIWGDLPGATQLQVAQQYAAGLQLHPCGAVMTAAHHGSETSTWGELLHTSPGVTLPAYGQRLLLISVGAGNRHGHPSPGVLANAERYHWRVERTDLRGSIILAKKDDHWAIRTTGAGDTFDLLPAAP